jgi:hypothetical protein
MQTTTVVRIKRQNNKIVQDCDIYIGRACNQGGWNLPQSKWHNPFSVKSCNGSVALAIAKFEEYLLSNPILMNDIYQLKGKTLGCWCAPGPCHGDVLAKLANA